MGRTRARRTAAALAAAVSSSLCPPAARTAGDADGKITLTVATFSDFGYKPLIKEYEKAHPPGIVVKERISQFDQHHNQLSTQIASGSGAADVVAIEEGYLPKFRAVKDKFTNLADYGADKRKSEYLDWKWDQGTLGGTDFVMGYGTDVAASPSATARTCSRRPGCPPTARRWPSSGPPGTHTSPPATRSARR